MGRMRAPQATMLRLRPPRMSRAPRQAYTSTRYWKSGEKAKEERPTPVKPSAMASERRRVKYCITDPTVGVKTKAQPVPARKQEREREREHERRVRGE